MNTSRKTIRQAAVLFTGAGECLTECEATLPDYYPPVVKVVRAIADGAVCSSSLRNGRLSVAGSVRFTLLYLSDRPGLLNAYSCAQDFSHVFDVGDGVEGCVSACTRTEYAACRLQGARRASFKATLGIYVSVLGRVSAELPAAFDDTTVVRERSFEVCDLVGCAQKQFKVEGEGSVEAGDDPVGTPLHTVIHAVAGELKVINNKVIAKGTARASTLYVRQSGIVGRACFEFPFSQVADLDGVREGCDCRVAFTVCDAETSLSDSGDGKRNIFEYDLTLLMTVYALECASVTAAVDAFDARFEAQVKTCAARFTRRLPDLSGEAAAAGSVRLPEATRVLDVEAVPRIDSAAADRGAVTVTGRLDASILYETPDGGIESAERSFPFETVLAGGEAGADSEAAVTVLEVGGESDSEGGVSLRARLAADIRQWRTVAADVVSELEVHTDRPHDMSDRAPVSICFARAGEQVWDIAKRFLVDPGRIAELNGVGGDVLDADLRLLVPRRPV